MNYLSSTALCSVLMLVVVLSACSDGVVIDGNPVDATDSSSDSMNLSDDEGLGSTDENPVLGSGLHDAGFKGLYFSGSGQCTACHDGLQDETGSDVSIVADWSGSMMANAARDPYWIAKLAAEVHRSPLLSDSLNDNCSRCHAPMANDTARKNGTTLSLLGERGLLDSSNELFSHAMEGVSCTLCHQIEDDGLLGTEEGVSGNFSIRLYERAADRPAYGQYSDPSGIYMQTQAQFKPVYGPHVSTSESCAACHDLRTAGGHQSTESAAVTASSFFPEQMIFSEWQHSQFSRGGASGETCQSCHMPVIEGSVMLSSQGGGVPREKFARHTFLGANTVMQNLLLQFRDELGLGVSAEELLKSIQRNRRFLTTAASVKIESSQLNEQVLTTQVRIRNQTGHKLPSGYPSRRVFVHFVVRDSNEAVVFQSGRLNEDGSVDGLDSDKVSDHYEQHYDTIYSNDQVQVYESIMGGVDGAVTHTLMDATAYLKDNRLLPLGFDKVSAPDDVQVTGAAVQDANFNDGGDLITFKVADMPAGPLTVRAELIYQPLAYGHIQDLFKDDQLDAVARFKSQLESVELHAEVIATDSLRVSRSEPRSGR